MYDANNFMTNPAGGYVYNGVQQPQQKFNNVLTPEQIKKLQQKGTEFSLAITEDEMLRGSCNHRNIDGTGDSLSFDPVTQEAYCTICGYKFRPVDASITPEEIQEDVNKIVDVLQTIKIMFVDLPPAAAMEFFPIIPLLEKVPKLFELAVKNMNKHEYNGWNYSNRNMGAMNMFNNLQNIFAGMNNYQAQPGFNPAFQPQAPAQPVFNPGFQPQAPMMAPQPAPMPQNGFGYPGAGLGMPQMGGYQPANNGFQFVPGQQPQQVPATTTEAAPAPAKPAEDVTVTKTVTV